MLGIDEIKDYLKLNLKPGRYGHTLGVAKTAIELAELYNEDITKAEIAALAHDVAKNLDKDEMKIIINDNNINLSVDEESTKELWHAIVGPIVAKKVFHINDEDILGAIRWHTTGKENMSKLEKIIYLADLIEPTRKFDGVEEIREICFQDLDEGMIKALTHTTVYLLQSGCMVDLNTIKARNYLLYSK